MEKPFDIVLQKMQEKLNNKKIVVAVSTGIDSMVLLSLLEKLRNVTLIVAHVNHHKREQSNEEQAFIKSYCLNKNIILEIKELHFNSTKNFQDEARKQRYLFFKDVIDKYQADYLLTAHHATDDLETILMRLIKGSSLKGYAGIMEDAEFHHIYIYRPLLNVSKNDIMQYAKEHNIMYYNDESNISDDYLRNRIRHSIIPIIEEENPSIYKNIADYKEHINESNNFLFEKINNFINHKVSLNNNIYSFKIEDFLKESDYLQVQILFELLKPLKLSKNLILELIKQIKNNKKLIINNIINDYYLVKEYGFIKLGMINKEPRYMKIIEDGNYLINDYTNVEIVKNKCYFRENNCEICYNINNLPIIIRNRKDKDKIRIKNKLVNLSDYLTNKKISHFDRFRLVLTNDQDEVIYILGLKEAL